MKKIIFAVLMAASIQCFAESWSLTINYPITKELSEVADELNSICRDGIMSNDEEYKDRKDKQICETRDKLYNTIEKIGFCYGEHAKYSYEARWDVCNSHMKP